ncbi:DNA internalization-related competence protein ComEC/Rec2 [Lapidilactobacillus wuchangensis]|uniref:DNA internalization-related competence protein ComEC/Rec2 n=1 Tax=Lapidilactobacillus wuchangensis TaxID=2486001 RepID=UPI000F7AEC67|nr:DNA internalization-related competence protein ComEC/Rec2 [Lapidilactobacillus wuchangensis]
MVGLDHSFRGKVLLVALAMIIMSGLFWYQTKLQLGLLIFLGLVLFGRFIQLRSRQLWLLLVILLSLFAWRQLYFQNQLFRVPATIEQIRILPDQGQLQGDLLTGSGTTSEGIKVNYALQLATESLVNQLKTARQPQVLMVKRAKLQLIQPATNIGEFDYQQWAAHRGRRYQITGKLQQTRTVKPINWQEKVAGYRCQLQQRFSHYPPYCAFHLRTLVIGCQDANDWQLKFLLSSVGLIQIFSLSGLHLDLLIYGCRKLGAHLRIPDEWLRGGLVLALPIYVVFVGGQIGILRSVLLFYLRQLQLLGNFRWSTLDQYSWTLLICLWWRPACIWELGPQLSFGLTLAWRCLPRDLARWRRQLRLGYLSGLLILFATYKIELWAVLFGGLGASVLTIVILPLTWLTLFWPSMTVWVEPIWHGFYQLLAWGQTYCSWQISYGQLPLVILLLCLFSWLLASHLPKIKPRIILLQAILLSGPFLWWHLPIRQQVTIIDVGQGDSLLIQTSWPRRTLLIDTGGQLTFAKTAAWQQRPRRPQIERVTLPYLASQGINHLDYVVVTHQDADHLGDLGALLAQFPVKKLLFPAGMETNPQFQQQLRQNRYSTRYQPCLAGEQINDQQLHALVVGPQQPGTGTNEDSLCLWFALDNWRWLATGDLDQAGERLLQQHYPQLQADYLKVGHHGSRTSSDPAFIQQLQLTQAFISAGRQNRYGHPHSETILTLEQTAVPFLNTAQYGMIVWQEYPWRHIKRQVKIRTQQSGSETKWSKQSIKESVLPN